MSSNLSDQDQVLKWIIHACAEAEERCVSNKQTKNVPNLFTLPNLYRNTSSGSRVKKKNRSGSITLLNGLERLNIRTFNE